MSYSHIKRMDTYRETLPLTPLNYHLQRNTVRGGELIPVKPLDPLAVKPLDPVKPLVLVKPLPVQDVSITNAWIYPIPDAYKGIPSYLFTHTNKYSGGKSQVMLYDTYANFLDTTVYSKYKTQLKVIPQPPRFARSGYSNNWFDYIVITYGQKWRIIFTQSEKGDLNSTDFTSMYLDCVNMDGYVAALSEIYNDRETISPLEANAIIRIARNNDIANKRVELYNKEVELNKTTYNTGHTDGINDQKAEDAKAAAAQAEADREAQEQSDNSSSIWGSIATGLEIGLAFL